MQTEGPDPAGAESGAAATFVVGAPVIQSSLPGVLGQYQTTYSLENGQVTEGQSIFQTLPSAPAPVESSTYNPNAYGAPNYPAPVHTVIAGFSYNLSADELAVIAEYAALGYTGGFGNIGGIFGPTGNVPTCLGQPSGNNSTGNNEEGNNSTGNNSSGNTSSGNC